jgi:hypothetical protein
MVAVFTWPNARASVAPRVTMACAVRQAPFARRRVRCSSSRVAFSVASRRSSAAFSPLASCSHLPAVSCTAAASQLRVRAPSLPLE